MSIPIRVFTVVIKADMLDTRFPGGSHAYIDSRLGAAKDGSLIGVGAMSGVDVQFILDNLVALGLQLGRDIAIGDLVHGALSPAPGIVFRGRPFAWEAEVDTSGENA